MKSVISDLHSKFAEKTWNDTFQLVRRCMEKPRDESKPCETLVRSLERLQELFSVSSISTMRSRLEVIAKQQGMGFHITDAACYLTADLFYLEVVLLPGGGVEEVKVAPHGGSPVPSECLLQLLRVKNFADFSRKLAGLFSQYNIPGDNEVKLKLFTSLQCLGKDLQQISDLPRIPKDCDPKMDVINNSRIGCLIAGKEDCPLTTQFYIAPSDSHKIPNKCRLDEIVDLEPVVQTAQVTVSVSNVTHRLQMAPVVSQPPQLDPQGRPVFLPLNEVPNETLPACFLLRLQPAIPATVPLVNKLGLITDVIISDVDLQWAPLPKLLMRGSLGAISSVEALDEQDTIFTVSLSGMMHRFILPGAAWEAPGQRWTVMDSIPFTHPAHVPAILELLRQQCLINTLLSSCITPQHVSSGPVCDLHFELLPQTDSSFSVTFQQPNTDTLTVLVVNISDSHQIKCRLFGAGKGDPSVDEYISAVMKRCMSIPVTLMTLCTKLAEITSAPLSSNPLVVTEAQTDHSAPSSTAVTDTNRALTTFIQGAAVPEDNFAVSASSCVLSVAKSEMLSEINASPDVNPYPFPTVGVFHWMDSNGHVSERI